MSIRYRGERQSLSSLYREGGGECVSSLPRRETVFVFYIEMREPLSLLYPPPRGEGKTPQMGKGKPPQRGAGKPPKKRTGAPCFSLSVVVGPPPSAVSFPSLTFVTGRSPFVVACPPSSAVSFASFYFVAGPSPFVVACPSPYVPRPHSLFSTSL